MKSDLLQKLFRFNKNFEQSALNDAYIPASFETPVLRHILINSILEKKTKFSPPLLLGIQGSYGMGKTFMVKELCKKYNIGLIQVSASDFSGGVEAASKDKFIKTYEEACIKRAKDKQYMAILIDDFHLSIATEDDVGKTVNSSLLTSAIMNICDNPWISSYRVPIILTGNNFTRVYGALVRVGRMELLSWTPKYDDIFEIVSRIFNSRFEEIDSSIIEELLASYPDNSIAFFSQVAEDILVSSFNDVLVYFKASNGAVDVLKLREKHRTSLENISSVSSKILDIAKERNSKIIKSYEGKSPNPNQVSKEVNNNE